MPSASRSITIDVPADHFFSVITDFESYPEFIPETVDVEILDTKKKGKGKVTEAKFFLKVIKKIDYTLRLTQEPNTRMHWELVEGPFKTNNGSWELEPAGKNKVKATYTVDITMGFLVPQSITNMLVGTSLPKMLESFKERAESTYGKADAKEARKPAKKKG